MAQFRPVKQIPDEIQRFLAGRPPLDVRQAALLAILQSVIPDENAGQQDT